MVRECDDQFARAGWNHHQDQGQDEGKEVPDTIFPFLKVGSMVKRNTMSHLAKNNLDVGSTLGRSSVYIWQENSRQQIWIQPQYCGEPVLLGVYIWQENSRKKIRIQPQYCRPGAFMGYSFLVPIYSTQL